MDDIFLKTGAAWAA